LPKDFLVENIKFLTGSLKRRKSDTS